MVPEAAPSDPPAPEPAAPVPLRILLRQTFDFMGKKVVLMLDEVGDGYLIDADRVEMGERGFQPVDVSDAIRPYSWDDELNRLIPNVETVRQNIRESFWRAGAFEREPEPAVRRRMFDTAFPYKHQF